MQKTKEFTCQYCGVALKNQGGVNLHERHCEKNPNKAQKENKKESKAKNEVHVCKFRLLNANSPLEQKAMQKGYREVCVECQELK